MQEQRHLRLNRNRVLRAVNNGLSVQKAYNTKSFQDQFMNSEIIEILTYAKIKEESQILVGAQKLRPHKKYFFQYLQI